ncbi:MAG: rhodanese-like domain-containing protein [Pseudomonadales bacterium]|jgi:rhodanese-related sulfurtransferase|nr:rhodanese-like domain-containing protein [Pseudomonadales bacterium]
MIVNRIFAPYALGAGIALVMLACGDTHAQVRRGGEIPIALENVTPSTGMCRRDDVAIAQTMAAAKEIVPALECAMSVEEVRKAMTNPVTQLVDLRTPAEFRIFHIDGALNLSLPQLLTKPYWRDKPVVLTGNGKGEIELYRACSRLRQSGYHQVRVLRGGMPMWLAQQQPVAGRAPAPEQLAQLAPVELWEESQNAHNLLVVDPGLSAMLSDLPGAVALARPDVEAIRAALEKRQKTHRNAPPASLIWVTEATPAQIQQVQDVLSAVPLLVYAQGREPFQRQLAIQQAVWAAQAKGPKRLGCGL